MANLPEQLVRCLGEARPAVKLPCRDLYCVKCGRIGQELTWEQLRAAIEEHRATGCQSILRVSETKNGKYGED